MGNKSQKTIKNILKKFLEFFFFWKKWAGMAHHIFSQAYFMTSIRPLLDDVLCLARRTNVVAWRRGRHACYCLGKPVRAWTHGKTPLRPWPWLLWTDCVSLVRKWKFEVLHACNSRIAWRSTQTLFYLPTRSHRSPTPSKTQSAL